MVLYETLVMLSLETSTPSEKPWAHTVGPLSSALTKIVLDK